jgi:ADP-heptose:LPS heptosyltransferase
MNRLVILAPNWLGDAVMALPAIADVRRVNADAHITVAPGAAYGGAKRWAPRSFAEVADALAADGVQSVLIMGKTHRTTP